MKRLFQLVALCAICGCLSPLFAQDVRCTPERGGAGCGFVPRVTQALEKLDLGCRRWTILILDEEEWAKMLSAYAAQRRILHTERAFTLHAARRTYLRQAYFAARVEPILIEVLAHEFAHLRICGNNEDCAREVAARIMQLLAAEDAQKGESK